MEALCAAWESTRSRADWSFAEFCELTNGWDCHAVTVDGQIAGAVMVKGPEIHACILPAFKGRWMSKAMLRILRGVVAEHGMAITHATTHEGARFVERLGFRLEGTKHILR
jgi:hypothetical protein